MNHRIELTKFRDWSEIYSSNSPQPSHEIPSSRTLGGEYSGQSDCSCLSVVHATMATEMEVDPSPTQGEATSPTMAAMLEVRKELGRSKSGRTWKLPTSK